MAPQGRDNDVPAPLHFPALPLSFHTLVSHTRHQSCRDFASQDSPETVASLLSASFHSIRKKRNLQVPSQRSFHSKAPSRKITCRCRNVFCNNRSYQEIICAPRQQ